MPVLQLWGGINGRGQPGNPADVAQPNAFNWHVALVANVPVFQGFYVQEQMGQVIAQRSALDHRVEDLRLRVGLEVRQALLAWSAAVEAQAAAQKNVAAARLALDIAESRYRSGLATILDVTDAQATLVTAEGSAVVAVYAARVARVSLMQAQGVLGGISARDVRP
jgi:outer membrane protein